MSGYIQNPPPEFPDAWWYPPLKFIEYPVSIAFIAAWIVP